MSFYIQSVEIGGPRPFYLLGPCSLECESFVWEMARSIKAIAENLDVPLIFKASYDKANRTSVTSFRGPGVREGCRILSEIGRELKLPVVTDVHTAQEAEIAAEYVDLLQVPAFLCRQTDLLEACAKSGRPVNIKKGQFLAPWDTVNIGEKMRAFGCDEFMMCERGTTFGYNNLVVDMRSLYWMKQEGFPVVFDATHAVQRPGDWEEPREETASWPPCWHPPPWRRAALTACSWRCTKTRPKRFPTAPTKFLSTCLKEC